MVDPKAEDYTDGARGRCGELRTCPPPCGRSYAVRKVVSAPKQADLFSPGGTGERHVCPGCGVSDPMDDNPSCDFDRIHMLPITPDNRRKVVLCAHHARIVDAAAPCPDVAGVLIGYGTGTRTELQRRCERPAGHPDRPKACFHSLVPADYAEAS